MVTVLSFLSVSAFAIPGSAEFIGNSEIAILTTGNSIIEEDLFVAVQSIPLTEEESQNVKGEGVITAIVLGAVGIVAGGIVGITVGGLGGAVVGAVTNISKGPTATVNGIVEGAKTGAVACGIAGAFSGGVVGIVVGSNPSSP